jgi:hypothetical protein
MLYVYNPKKGRMVPAYKRKIRVRSHWVLKGLKDHGNPDMAVPRALKSMSTNEENKLIRESGFSASHIKRVWEL